MVISNRNKARGTISKRKPRSPATGQGSTRNSQGEPDSRPRSVTAGKAATINLHGKTHSTEETTFAAATATTRAILSCNDLDSIGGFEPDAYDRYDDLKEVDVHIPMPADVSDDSYDDMRLPGNIISAFGGNSGIDRGKVERHGVTPYVKSGMNEPCYLELLPIARE